MTTFLDAKEVSRQFFNGKISYWTILKMAKCGDIPCIRSGRRYLFDLASLEQWKKALEEKPYWANAI